MDPQKIIEWIALIFVIIGGINWGLVGLFNLNLVETIFGAIPVLVTIIYIIAGLSGLYMIYYATKMK